MRWLARLLFAACVLAPTAAFAAIDIGITNYIFSDPTANGATRTFTVRATNFGATPLTDAIITINVSTDFTVDPSSLPAASNCVLAGSTITCSPASLPPGDTVITYNATATSVGTHNTDASISSVSAADPVLTNNSLTKAATVRQGADLKTTMVDGVGGTIPGGGTINYAITVTNFGPDTTNQVRLTDNLPAASDFLLVTPGNATTWACGTNWSCTVSGTTVVATYSGATMVGAGNPYPVITISGKATSDTSGTIANNAFAEPTVSTIIDPDGTGAAPTVFTHITPGTDLKAGKTMPAAISIGRTSTVKLTITNLGPQIASGATIADTIDSTLTIGAMPSGCVRAGQLVTCTAGSLDPNGTAAQSFNIPVSGATLSGGTLTNTATVSPPAGFTDPVSSNDSATVSFQVLNDTADLSITKTKTPNPVTPGATMTSVITITNNGPSSASISVANPLRIIDDLGSNETYVSLDTVNSSAGFSCVAAPHGGGQRVTCTLTSGGLGVGVTRKVTLLTLAGAGATGSVDNTACTGESAGAGGTLPTDLNTSNDCVTVGSSATSTHSNLTLLKEVSTDGITYGPTTELLGPSQFLYQRLTVSNAPGADTAPTVTVSDPLSGKGISTASGFVTAAPTLTASTGTPSWDNSAKTASWTLTSLAGGQSENLVIKLARPLADGSFTNVASVATPDSFNLNTTTTASASYIIDPVADMTLTAMSISPNPAQVGVPAGYTITAKNIGQGPASGVTISGSVDVTKFILEGAPTNSSGATCTADPVAGTFSCTLPTPLIRNATFPITQTVRPRYPFGAITTFPTSYTATATVSTTTTESDVTNNSRSLTHNVNGPVFDLGITNGEPDSTYDPIGYGPDLTYDIHVINSGQSRANDIQAVTFPAPPAGYTMTYHDTAVNPAGVTHGLTLATNVSAASGCTYNSGLNQLLCRIDQTTPANNYLDGDHEVVFRVHFTPGGAVTPVAPLTFKITSQITATEQNSITVSQADANLANNHDITETTTVLPSADLAVTAKTPSISSASVGQPISYTILIKNNGVSDTTQVRVTDTLPAGFVLDTGFTPTAVGTGGGASVSTIVCTGTTAPVCVLDGAFPSGGTASITLQALAAFPYAGPIGSNVTNTATIAPGQDGGGNNLTVDSDPTNNSKTANVQIVESSIAGTVFLDVNANNVVDAGDGLGSVTLTLDGTDNWGHTVPTQTTTSAAGTGAFKFDHLPAGTYVIVETQPGGANDGLETAGTSGGTVNNGAFDATAAHNTISAISLAANTAATGYKYQEVSGSGVNGAINGRVFKDPQRDGVDSGGEPGIGGVTVILTQGATTIATTTTAADGSYSFTGLTPGAYTVTETQPAGYGSSSPDGVGATVTAGGIATVNFADTVSTIAGSVFIDTSGDGVRQAGESGIPGVTVKLTGTATGGGAVSRTTTTDGSGNYKFSDLLSGTYTLTETQPAAYLDGLDSVGSVGGTLGNDVLSAIALPTGTDATDYAFGEHSLSIHGTVYVDGNLNGTFDGGEKTLGNVAVALQTPGGTTITATTTAADGTYHFDNVASGSYLIVETQPDGYGNAAENGGNRANLTVDTSVPPAVNFGERTGSIAGSVYNDSNRNGSREQTEPPIAGVTVTLQGTDATGHAVSRTAVTGPDGSFLFNNVVGGGYTLIETQPAGYDDGADAPGSAGGSALPSPGDTISGIALGAAQDAVSYLFGERGPGAELSGSVWFDANHDGVRDISEIGKAGWTVQLFQSGVIVGTTTTDANGEYKFTDLPPGSGYSLLFREPTSQAAFGSARPNETGLPATDGVTSAGNPGGASFSSGQIRQITLNPGANIQQQSLPLDPSGVVYDSVTRQVVPGATVKITGPAGFDPATQLLGGAINASQTVGADGFYQFLLLAGAPNGTYTITYSPPASGAFSPVTPSTRIVPCAGPFTVGSTPDPMLISSFDGAPPASAITSCTVGQASTAYYLSFVLTAGVSANVVNNNLPLDPILQGAIVVTKTTPMRDVTRGGLVPYTITAKDVLASAVPNVAITDRVPAGFRYRTGSARLNGAAVTPVENGRLLTFPPVNFAAGETKTYDLILTVGAGVGDGEHVNQAWAVNNGTDTIVSNVAEATVRIEPDADFDCTDILGKVFDDKNGNGVEDQGEPGLPGVRVVTVAGDLITTDKDGRYHITCPAIPNEERGSNFILKLDPRTLPTGYRLTTDNPETVRLTRGKFVKLNFGASLLRVVRLDVQDAVFKGEEIAPDYLAKVDGLIATLEGRPSVLRIVYVPRGEEPKLVKARVAKLKALIEHKWSEKPRRCRLIIEVEESW